MNTIVRRQDRQKNNSENKNQIFEKKEFSFFLHGEKENFEEYSLNLAFAKLSFPTVINYSAGKCRTCPWTMVFHLDRGCNSFCILSTLVQTNAACMHQ